MISAKFLHYKMTDDTVWNLSVSSLDTVKYFSFLK